MAKSALIGRVAAAILAVPLLLNAGTGPALSEQLQPQPAPMILPVDPAPLVVDTGAAKESFTVEIADDEIERARGLMFRENMAPDHGMLFVYPAQQSLGFWMRNTILPLDLIFIDKDGKVVGVEKGKPYSDDLISPGVDSQFVLELNAGTAEKIGLKPGATVRHPSLGAN